MTKALKKIELQNKIEAIKKDKGGQLEEQLD
jgi:hypothetical protein